MNAIAENLIRVDELQKLLPGLTQHLSKEDKEDIKEIAQLICGPAEVDEEEFNAAVKAFFEIFFGHAPKLVEFPLSKAPSTLAKWKEFIGKRVAAERKKQGITQVELAVRTELPQSHISRIERAKLAPSHLTLCKIAAALNIPLSALDPSAPIE